MARKRRTSKIRRKKSSQVLHLNVRTPRVIAFQTLKIFKGGAKVVLILSLFLGALWGVKTWIGGTYSKNAEFVLDDIRLDSPNGMMSVTRLVDVTDIELGCSIFDVNLKGVEEKLEALPEILSAEARRELPRKLIVKVKERQPIAWMECRAMGIAGRNFEKGYLFDESGVIFPCSEKLFQQIESLPVISIGQNLSENLIVGEQIENGNVIRALALAKSSLSGQPEMPRIDRIILLNSYSMEAWIGNGTKALFGMHEHERQLTDLYTILNDAYEKGKRVLEINLIPKRNIPVKYDSSASLSHDRGFLVFND